MNSLFELKQLPIPDDKFTHALYYKGQLVSKSFGLEDGYYVNKGSLEMGRREFIFLQVGDLCPYVQLETDFETVHNEYFLGYMSRTKDGIRFDVYGDPEPGEPATRDQKIFFVIMNRLAKKFGFEKDSRGIMNDHWVKRYYNAQPEEELQTLFRRLKKDFEEYYSAAEKIIKESGNEGEAV